jgi:hypothetical protein
MPNIHRPEFEEGERPEGFKSRRASTSRWAKRAPADE